MHRSSLAILLLAGITAPVAAQTLPADKMLQDMLTPTSNPSDVTPTSRPSAPGALEPAGYSAPATSKLLREDSDVIARAGHLEKITDSPFPQFVFDNKAGESQLAPMLVLPNLQLMSMEDAASVTGGALTFTVCGRVTEYGGKNYILLEAGPDDLNNEVTLPSKYQPSTQPSGDKQPISADDMLKQMLEAEKGTPSQSLQAAPAKQIDATSGSAAVAPNAPVLNTRREGTQMIDRVCRLNRTVNGTQEQLTFDSDRADMEDPPLIVLPNLKLGALEGAAAGDNHDPQYRVTGTLTEYRGRNYILLQKVIVMAPSGRQF